ncbi:MAG: type IV secretion system DNA-binding domain-containing protein, partial [Verrucomicrobiae bacterium]|nr:type IV secretion system DNA-binding domain-containing protein [Verrucomicrobiae bacterium]
GAFVRDFYDPARDIIINPFDARSRAWSPFHEAQTPSFFTQLAEVLIPDRPGSSDPFWTQSARIVFDYAAQSLWKTPNASNAALRDAILQIPSADLAALIDQTPGRHFFSTEIAKTADSIRANLIAELRFLEFLRDDAEPFSVRRWVKEGGEGFVFLTGDAEHAAATRNITSAIFEVAANALLTCEETSEPRIWFMMDEV